MQPRVELTILDGQLGIIPFSFGDVLAVVGPSSAGPIATPAAFARAKDVVSNYGSGPMVQAAALAITLTGKPVVVVRTTASTAATESSLDTTGFSGTSVPTIDASTAADDDYEVYVLFTVGGTIGTAGITYQWSLDGGRTLSAEVELGTAVTLTIPTVAGLVKLDFAAGTVVTGSYLSFRTTAAVWNNTDLQVALDALTVTKQRWNFALIVGAAADAAVRVVDTWLVALAAAHKFKHAIMNTRIPNIGESEATYKTSLDTDLSDVATLWVNLCAASCKQISAVDARNYRRPVSWIVAVRTLQADAGQDLAEVAMGPLPGTSLADENGNPEDHDETIYPGLDDSRFTTLRSFEGRPGVFVNNGRIFASEGSDFIFVQFRRVMNYACEALVSYLEFRLSAPVRLNPKTGFISEAQAKEFENGASHAMGDVLLPKKRVTSVAYVVSRTDNILSTFTITGEARIVPLGYVKVFSTTIAFNNPALRAAA